MINWGLRICFSVEWFLINYGRNSFSFSIFFLNVRVPISFFVSAIHDTAKWCDLYVRRYSIAHFVEFIVGDGWESKSCDWFTPNVHCSSDWNGSWTTEVSSYSLYREVVVIVLYRYVISVLVENRIDLQQKVTEMREEALSRCSPVPARFCEAVEVYDILSIHEIQYLLRRIRLLIDNWLNWSFSFWKTSVFPNQISSRSCNWCRLSIPRPMLSIWKTYSELIYLVYLVFIP